jgi:hypothetical protein
MLALALTALCWIQAPPAVAAQSNNPCDLVAGLPICNSALGPMRDVTTTWRQYQPALVQPVPEKDYCPNPPSCSNGDPEDGPPPGGTPTIFAAGHCLTETVNQPDPPAAPIPGATEASSLPTTIVATAPPGKNHPYAGSPYCVLRYAPTDFDQLCAGCRRIFIDYAAIPLGNYVSPAPPAGDGHWAARFTLDFSFSATTPFNAHSPNFKNLCSDKKFNPAKGSDCIQGVSQFDMYGHDFEGDTTVFHHFPYEGRYYNGPAYLAGTSPADYHWVQGAYFDVDPAGASQLGVFYNAGYRGAGDVLPDTDWSYGCACEVPFQPLGLPGLPGSGHTTWSASLVLQDLPVLRRPITPAGASPSRPPGGLPATSTAEPSGALLAWAATMGAFVLLVSCRRRGRVTFGKPPRTD